jgi:hypothetical protein
MTVARAVFDGMLRNYLGELDSILDARLQDGAWSAKKELLTALKHHVYRLRQEKLLTEELVRPVDEAVQMKVSSA